MFFAFSTIIGWYYYGSKCIEYIFGLKSVKVYKWVWVAVSFVGATIPLQIVWDISDVFNGFMAMPNLVGLLALSPMIFEMTREYDKKTAIEKNILVGQLAATASKK